MCVQLTMCIVDGLSITDCVITALTIPLSMLSLRYLNVRQSPMTVFLLIHLFCSFSIVALTKFYPLNFSLNSHRISDENFVVMASYSVRILFFYFSSVIISNSVIERKNERWRYETFINPTYTRINLLILFLTVLGFISLVVGIGRMGQVNTRLPFHLAGIIQFVRVEVAPFLALLFYMSIKKEIFFFGSQRKKYYFLTLFFCWTLLETFVRISKSAIAFEFLPILTYEIIENAKRGSLKSLFIRLIPFAFVLLAVYSIVENSRSSDELVFESEKGASATYNDHGAQNPIVRPYTRFFINGHHFLTSYYVVDQNSLFDFSNMFSVLATGGAARYKTIIIDGYPRENVHSSGCSSIVDALICGGYGLSYIVVIMLVFVCVKVDQLINSTIPLISALVLALFVFKYITAGLSVSIIVDPMAINGILVTLFLLFIFNRIKGLPNL